MSVERCPACGARNRAGAAWCTQCYATLDVGAPPGGIASGSTDEPREGAGDRKVVAPATSAPREADAGRPALGASAPAGGGGRDVRERGDGVVEWRCRVCEGWSALESPSCEVCGSRRTGFGDRESVTVRPEDEERLLAASLLVPGLGHIRAGRVGTGVARALFGIGWLVGGVTLLVAAGRAGMGPWAGLLLVLAAVVVWALTVLDVRALARGAGRERLDARTLTWLVVGVTVALMGALLLDALRMGP